MIHAQRRFGVTYCTAQGPVARDMPEVTCSECLWHVASEALEGPEVNALEALEAVRRIAELAYPHLLIETRVRAAGVPMELVELKLT